MHRLVDSRFGAALQCARMNPDRLATLGIAPFPVKLTAFTLSAMVTGLAGALFAELNGFVSPSMPSWQRSGEIIVFVILGGVGRLFGSSEERRVGKECVRRCCYRWSRCPAKTKTHN